MRPVEHALEYADRYGWKLIPIAERGKSPLCGKGWQNQATSDEDQLIAWWEQWPNANVGLLLGRKSMVIDVECDSAEAEQFYLDLWEGNPPVTPTYQANRGKHRLFKWSPDLPCADKAVFKLGPNNSLEFRTGNGDLGAQSVLPPSVHASGRPYTWLVSPDECEPAEIPPHIIGRLLNMLHEGEFENPATRNGTGDFKQNDWKEISKGAGEGSRNDYAAKLIGKHLSGLRELTTGSLETVWELVCAWNQQNDPPLRDKELRTTFDSILRRERQKRVHEEVKQNEQLHEALGNPEDWKLIKVLSNPVVWRLYSPWWKHKAPGYLELSNTELHSFPRMQERVSAQFSIELEPWFRALFFGHKDKTAPNGWRSGLKKQLMEVDECIPPPAGMDREADVALQILNVLSEANDFVNGQPDEMGRPRRAASGQVYFQLAPVIDACKFNPEPPTRMECSAILRNVGVATENKVVGSQRIKRKYMVLSQAGLGLLEQMATRYSEKDAPELHVAGEEPGAIPFDVPLVQPGHPDLFQGQADEEVA